MSYTVIFKEVNGFEETLGTFPSEDFAIRFIKDNVNTVDLETLGAANVNGTYEPWTLFQDNEILGCYRIAA